MKSAGQIIIDNLARVRERIEEATLAAHRAPGEVTLIAVSKYVGLTESAALLEASCLDLGESRPQQLWEKASSQSLSDARWHLVGHLQRNKVRRTLPLTDVIHSVDSLRLLAAINGVAAELELRPRLLLEVNATGEAQKHGLSAGELSATLEAAEGFSNVRIVGLMAMAPRNGGVDAAR
ncbi:MAG: alanine racemase, partial [Planctomycetota bacterium]